MEHFFVRVNDEIFKDNEEINKDLELLFYETTVRYGDIYARVENSKGEYKIFKSSGKTNFKETPFKDFLLMEIVTDVGNHTTTLVVWAKDKTKETLEKVVHGHISWCEIKKYKNLIIKVIITDQESIFKKNLQITKIFHKKNAKSPLTEVIDSDMISACESYLSSLEKLKKAELKEIY